MIWKYKLVIGEQDIEIPRRGSLLAAQVQNKTDICVWVEFEWPDDGQPEMDECKFIVRPTGEPFEEFEDEQFLETVAMNDGEFMRHVYFVSDNVGALT